MSKLIIYPKVKKSKKNIYVSFINLCYNPVKRRKLIIFYIFINIALVILSIFLVFCGLLGKKFKDSFINKIFNNYIPLLVNTIKQQSSFYFH